MALNNETPLWQVDIEGKGSNFDELPEWFTNIKRGEVVAFLPRWFGDIHNKTPDEILDEGTESLDLTSTKVNEGGFEAQLMSFIRSKEAPRFGYDSWYGRGTSRGAAAPPKPPTQMTVSEVLEWQQIANPPGPGTAAVGAYQIVDQPNARTLSSLVKEMGLTGDELFTPELQDRMAMHLLRRRGLDKYLAGSLDAQTFANKVAREWASMPVLKDDSRGNISIARGQSYYKGDGINKALVGPKELEKYENIYSLADIS